MAINAFIFDFGGVLLDWDPSRLYRKRFPDLTLNEINHFFRQVDFTDWNLQQDKGRSFDEGVEELSRRFPWYADLIRAYHQYWPDTITGPIHGTVEILKQIKQSGFALYGLTNFSMEKYKIIQHQFDFITMFEDVIVSGDVKLIKPDPAIYELTLARIRQRPEDCVYIDDSFPNVIAAQKLGMHAIQFQSPEKLLDDLRGLGLLSQTALTYHTDDSGS